MNKIYLWGVIVTAIMFAATGYTLVETAGGKKDLSEVLSGDIVNTLAIAGAIALVIITVFVVIKYVRQMQVDTADGELTEDTWDDIGEYYNPIPTGWAITYLLTMIWGMWYFVAGYPVNSYSQIGEYNKDVRVHDAKFTKEFNEKMVSLNDQDKAQYMIDMGESVFIAECKVCHGLDANGIAGKAADLTVRLEAGTVKDVIINGSNNSLLGSESPMPGRDGIMNANNNYAPITDAEIDAVSTYVANGMKGEGSDVFAGACAACHGEDGKGMEYVAPNIATYDATLVTNVLNHGKKGSIGTMPAFDRLNSKQKEAVSAYIISLSKGE